MCRRLGATFIKLAQALSTRADIVAEPVRRELTELCDRVGPFSYDAVQRVVLDELGAPPEGIFEQFDPYPVASASVAQVHWATLPGGREVAVKVLRPGIERQVERDLRVMRIWARALGWFPWLRVFALPQVLDEFGSAVSQQLDLRIEAANNERFSDNFRGDPSVEIPTLVQELCTRRILCMRFVRGEPILDEERSTERREEIARTGFRMLLKMVFIDGFVHADLHPGNMFVRGDRLVLFDMGLVAKLSQRHRRALVDLCLAWAARDVESTCAAIAEIAFWGQPPTDSERLAAQVREMMDRLGDIELGEIQVGRLLLDMLRLVRRQWHRIDTRFTMVALSVAVVEGVGRQLSPRLKLIQEALPFFRRETGPAEQPRQA